MSIGAIRAAIKAKLDGIADLGQVHDRQRWAKDAKTLADLYRSATHGEIRGWDISWESLSETDGHVDDAGVEVIRWVIRGRIGFEDADGTEKVLEALVDAIRAAFKADQTLGGVVAQISDPDGGEFAVQVAEYGPIRFAGALCWSAELKLLTVRYL